MIDLSFMELTQVNVELYIHTILAAGVFIKVSGSAPIKPGALVQPECSQKALSLRVLALDFLVLYSLNFVSFSDS